MSDGALFDVPGDEPLSVSRVFDPLRHGITRSYVSGAWDVKTGAAELHEDRLKGSLRNGGVVGSCRVCGADLLFTGTEETGGRTNYLFQCSRPLVIEVDDETKVRKVSGCGAEMVAPGGLALLRSSAMSERRAALGRLSRNNPGN